jgi:hypothetical protein
LSVVPPLAVRLTKVRVSTPCSSAALDSVWLISCGSVKLREKRLTLRSPPVWQRQSLR